MPEKDEKSVLDKEAKKANTKTNKETSGEPKDPEVGADDKVNKKLVANKTDEKNKLEAKDIDSDEDDDDAEDKIDDIDAVDPSDDADDGLEKMKKAKEAKAKAKKESDELMAKAMGALQLDEEQTELAEALMKSAFEAKLRTLEAELDEKYATKYAEAIEAKLKEIEANVVETLDLYTTQLATDYAEKNKVAITEAAELAKYKTLAERIVAVAEEVGFDTNVETSELKEGFDAKVDEQSEKINTLMKRNQILEQTILLSEVKSSIVELQENMTSIDKEKFSKLVEDVDFETLEDFNNKASAIKEHFFEESVKETEDTITTRFESYDNEIGVNNKSTSDGSLMAALKSMSTR